MTRSSDQVDADAWRTIRVAGKPIVSATTAAPRDVIAAAHARLREMRAEAHARTARQVDGEGLR